MLLVVDLDLVEAGAGREAHDAHGEVEGRVVGGQQLEADQPGNARLARIAVVPVAARGVWPGTAGERSPHAVDPDHSGGRPVHQRELAAGGAVLEAPSRQVVPGTVDARLQLA